MTMRHLHVAPGYVVLSILWLLLGTMAQAASPRALLGPPCQANQRVVECLAAHHTELFETDEERFTEMLIRVERDARRCKPLERTREYVELVRTVRADGWVAESVDETVEHLIRWKPRCFLDALVASDPEARVWVVDIFLEPSLHAESPRHWMKAVMQKYRKEPKYQEIMRQYFGE